MGKGKVIFLKNAALLTVTSLVLRFVGMIFRVWLAAGIGAEGMGLYQQIFSIYTLISVFASSGVGMAVTRLVSEELTLGHRRGVDMIIIRSMAVTLFTALFSGLAVFLGSNAIAVYIMSDERAAESLRIMCFSLPFMAVSAVLKGYFFARKRAFPNSSSQLIEQAVRIGFIFMIFSGGELDAERGCAAVLFGDAVAELSSAAYLSMLWLFDRKRLASLNGRERPPYRITASFLRIASPIAAGRYLNSLLRTAENLLVPMNLQKYGMEKEQALSDFGAIKGMALPLLLFPAGLLSSVTSLLVPEMSEAAAAGHGGRIRYAAERSIALTFLASIPFATVFFFAAEPLCELIYGSASVGYSVRALAPLVPLMYIDSVCDALLKALDKQMTTFRHSIFDSLGRIALILAVLPLCGTAGFLGIMYASNLFTSLLNLTKLLKTANAKMNPLKQIFLPVLITVTAGLLFNFAAGCFNIGGLVYIILLSLFVAAAYLPYIMLSGVARK